jgi:hypothetical protein
VAGDTTSRASRGEEDEDITEKENVRLESVALLLGELLVLRVKLEPDSPSSAWGYMANQSAMHTS